MSSKHPPISSSTKRVKRKSKKSSMISSSIKGKHIIHATETYGKYGVSFEKCNMTADDSRQLLQIRKVQRGKPSRIDHNKISSINEKSSLLTIKNDVKSHKKPKKHLSITIPLKNEKIRADKKSLIKNFTNFLDKYFEITARGSTIATEIRGGTVAFLTLAYIILLNPQVLSASGIPAAFASSSTCLSSAIATLICGIFGNLPVGCGPGIGLSAYFSYGMIPSIIAQNTNIEHPFLSGLLMTFFSGAVVFTLTVIRFIPWLLKHMPHFLKISAIVGIGLFLSFIGMIDIGLVVRNNGDGNAFLGLGDISSWMLELALFNLLCIATFTYFNFKGGLLLCIVITTIIYFAILEMMPDGWFDIPLFLNPTLIFNIDQLSKLPASTTLSSMISFIFIIILDVSGVTFGIGKIANLIKEDGCLVGQKWALIGTSVGTMIAAMTGCSPIIVCIETSSGAAAGSRTGLSACVIAVYFMLALFLGPIFSQVPAAATAPVLIFIGTLMMSQVSEINWKDMRIAIPAFLCIVLMPFTYSIANGLFFGVAGYALTYVTTMQWRSLKWCRKCFTGVADVPFKSRNDEDICSHGFVSGDDDERSQTLTLTIV